MWSGFECGACLVVIKVMILEEQLIALISDAASTFSAMSPKRTSRLQLTISCAYSCFHTHQTRDTSHRHQGLQQERGAAANLSAWRQAQAALASKEDLLQRPHHHHAHGQVGNLFFPCRRKSSGCG